MCLRNLQKYLVYGALIKAEKLTLLLPMYLLNLAWIMGTSTQLMGVSTPPKGLQMYLCVSEPTRIFGVWSPNGSKDIDLSTPKCICSTCPCYWALALCTRVCQHLPSSLVMFPCVSGTSKKYLVHGALVEAEILTSTLPHAFVQLNPVLSAGTLPEGVSTPPK